MSFPNKNEKCAGPLRGNPLTGLCEKASIMVDKVFDSCLRQETLTNTLVNLAVAVPSANGVLPTFVSGRSNGLAVVEDLEVTELGAGCCARVQCTLRVPVEICYTYNGTAGVAYGTITIEKDVVLNVSAPSAIPYEIKAIVNVVMPNGMFLSSSEVSVTACSTQVLNVTMPVQLLVPSYGYTHIPPCREYTNDVCEGVFDLPLYPEECGVEPRCCNTFND